MRHRLLFICSIISFSISTAQPTQSEIDKMIEQAKRIANNQKADNNSVSKKVTRQPEKFPSSVASIPLKTPVSIPTSAQAKDKLLWYKGKKINDSMLVTAKGMIVLYNKKRGTVTLQPSQKNDAFQKIINNLSKARQLTNDYLTKMAATKNSFMNYPLIQLTIDEFSDIDERFNTLVKNTIELPSPALTQHSLSKQKGGIEVEPDAEGELDEMHKNLKELLRNPPPINFKAPPKKEFSLAYTCDSNAQKQYKKARKEWEEEFLDYENNLISSVLQIERYMSLTGNISISKNEPGSPTLAEDMQKAFQESLNRVDAKVKALTGQHGKNIFSQDIVLFSILQNERKKQLLGMSENTEQIHNAISELVEGEEFENYIKDQIKELNYDVIFNVANILGRGRQSIFLGSGTTAETMWELFNQIQKLNRFALTAETDFNMQYNDSQDEPMLKASSKIVTKDKTYVSLGRNGCKWTLYLAETDYQKGEENQYYIPMKITGGTKKVKQEKDNWISYSYTGPANMLMHFPVFKIDFGDHVHEDTAIVQPLRYDPGISLSGYANNIANSYTIDLLGYLSHVFTSASKAEINQSGLTNIANDIMKKFSSATNFSGTSTLDQLKSKYQEMLQKIEFEKSISDLSGLPKTTIFFNAFNSSPVLINDETNTAHKDKQVEVTKGLIRLKVVHDPITN